jgi:hypothetical protein
MLFYLASGIRVKHTPRVFENSHQILIKVLGLLVKRLEIPVENLRHKQVQKHQVDQDQIAVEEQSRGQF